MKNTNFSRCVKLWVAALVLVCGVAFTGCKPGVDKPALPAGVKELSADSMLIGEWAANDNEKYIITSNTFESENTYKGDALVIKQDNETSGTIYVKYSEIYDWDKDQKDEPADTTGWLEFWGTWYPTNTELIGKWYAISYKNLTSSSIDIAGAMGTKKCTDTIEEAITEFTVENGYFATYSTCAKQ